MRRLASGALLLGLVLTAGAPAPAWPVVGPLESAKVPPGEPIAQTTVVLPRDEPWRVQNPGWRAFGVGVGVSVLWLDDLDPTELATRVTTGDDTTTIPGDPDEVDRKLSREGHLAAVQVHLPVGLPAFSLPAGWRLYSALDLRAGWADVALDFQERTGGRAEASLEGDGPIWGAGLDLVAASGDTGWFAGAGYLFEWVSNLDLARDPPFGEPGLRSVDDETTLDLQAHVLFVRLGRVVGNGRFAPYAGVRGRWTRIDLADTLQLEGADGGGVRIDTETRLEAHLLQAVAGLDARLGGPFYARAEVRAGEEGTSALLKLIYRNEPSPGEEWTEVQAGPDEGVPTAPAAGQDDEACAVEITGSDVVCLACTGRQRETVLTAEAKPRGGRYDWSISKGEERVRWKRNRPPTRRATRARVEGRAASEAREDVEVRVTYRVRRRGNEVECADSHPLTVVQPRSVRVREEPRGDWPFQMTSGAVQIPQEAPPDVRRKARQIERLGRRHQATDGPIRILYYEVLDQFGDRLLCDGRLEEVITPGRDLRVGGTELQDGVATDHLFRLQNLSRGGAFRPETVVQEIRVLGCPVRYNRIRFTAQSVDVQELSEEAYDAEREELSEE